MHVNTYTFPHSEVSVLAIIAGSCTNHAARGHSRTVLVILREE